MDILIKIINYFLINSKSIKEQYKSSNAFSYMSYLGAFLFAKQAFDYLNGIRRQMLTFEKDLKKEYGNGWVVITGATDGIGKSLAVEFAKRNHKILVITRDESKTLLLVEELKKENKILEIDYIIYDLNRSFTNDDINELREKFSKYTDISILINNAGYGVFGHFEEISDQDIRSMININVIAVTQFIKIIISAMESRKKSLIVGVGSIASVFQGGYTNVYAASKTYMECLMKTIAQEHDNIDYCYLTIGSVLTKSSKQTGMFTVSTDEIAAKCMKFIGNYENTAPHYLHALQRFIIKSNFGFISNYIRRKNNNELKLKFGRKLIQMGNKNNSDETTK